MKTEQTEDRFLAITSEEVSYHKTATEAVEAAGCPPWDSLYPAIAARSLEPGDELSVTRDGSVIRITGRDISFYE